MSSSEHHKAVQRFEGARREQDGLGHDYGAAEGKSSEPAARQSRDRGSRSGTERARDAHLLDLQMRARYHRDRHRLYAARMGGSRPTSLRKLEELKRARELAEGSLRRYEAERKQASSRDSDSTEGT